MDRKQRLYRERILLGVCTKCGKAPPDTNIKTCRACRDYSCSKRNNDKAKQSKGKLKDLRLSLGLCIYCGLRQSDYDQKSCQVCRDYRRPFSRKTRENRANLGLCVRCGTSVSYQRYKICQDCRRNELAAKRAKYLEHGLCKTCGKLPTRTPETTICHRCYDRLKRNKKLRYQKLKREVFEHYGSRCACCGEQQFEFLTIDHVNGDGAVHKRAIGRDSRKMYQWVKNNNYPDAIQILCYNCNCAKGVYGTCPHRMQSVSRSSD